MRKFIRVLTALILALSLTSLTACDILNGIFGTPSTPPPSSSDDDGSDDDVVGGGTVYTVTFETNGGTLTGGFTSYTSGADKSLPQTVTKDYYVFDGWYDNELLSGSAVTKISAADTGDKTFYAKWTPETYDVELYVDGVKYAGADNLTTYTYNTETSLPVPVKNSFNFNGWYTSEECNGTKVTSIAQGEYGNKTYYGEWIPVIATELEILHSGGYEEGAYVEFINVQGLTLDDYEVNYKKSSDSVYTEIDSELIRIDENNIVRADIVGISEGDYTVQVIAGNKGVVTENVTATAYDRSGYAHFKLSSSSYKDGVGGYKSDGTPKDNAQIIYVTEENKNTVSVTWGSNEYTGIVSILKNSKNAQAKIDGKTVKNLPVIIRIVGRISAATWNAIDYSKFTDSNGHVTADIIANNTIDKNGNKLSKAEHSQSSLISSKYNTLNEYEGCTELENLDSKIKYDSSKKEFDSCWNDCSVSGANNVTVEGIGTDAELFQWGITFKSSNSIEVRNLTFDDYTEDACSFEGSTSNPSSSQRIWLHHNTFNEGVNYWDVCNEQDKHDGDGSTDFKGVSYITIAYNHYIKTHKTGLIGGSDTHLQSNITFHHNYYEGCKSRLPLARQANMHMYNNYYNGTTDTCLSIRANGYAFIENCYFENANNPLTTQGIVKKIVDGQEVIVAYAGTIKAYGCVFNGIKPDMSKFNGEIVTDRAAVVENHCDFGRTFDTDTNKFYYDANNKKSDVTLLTTAEQAKIDCIEMSGVHKN